MVVTLREREKSLRALILFFLPYFSVLVQNSVFVDRFIIFLNQVNALGIFAWRLLVNELAILFCPKRGGSIAAAQQLDLCQLNWRLKLSIFLLLLSVFYLLSQTVYHLTPCLVWGCRLHCWWPRASMIWLLLLLLTISIQTNIKLLLMHQL